MRGTTPSPQIFIDFMTLAFILSLVTMAPTGESIAGNNDAED